MDRDENGVFRLRAVKRLSIRNYRLSQRWSRTFHHHRGRPDGILYCSRHDPSCRCVAIFDGRPERADASALSLGSLAEPRHRALLGHLLDLYELKLLAE